MAEKPKEQSDIASRQTNATTRRIKVRADKIKVNLDRYCHRDSADLSEDSLKGMSESQVREGGIQVPIEVFINEQGDPELLKGHRRLFGHRFNAAKNVEGFKLDSELDAIEVVDFNPVDLLIRSIADNEVRLNLDKIGRIRVAKKLYDAGVQEERAACAMGISVQTYRRLLAIAKHPWMFQHVIDGSIELTNASALLDLAEEHGRLKELREDLDAFVADKKKMIRDREKLQKARDNTELPPGDKLVKKYMNRFLIDHWKDLLKNHKRFDEDAQWTFNAGIVPESEELRIKPVTLNLATASLDQLAKVAGKLSLVTKQMIPYIQKAREKESGAERTPAAVAAAYDIEFLRGLGLEQVADDLEAQTRQDNEPDGEELPQEQPAERQEQDLTKEVKLPDAGSTTPPQERPATPPAMNGEEGKK